MPAIRVIDRIRDQGDFTGTLEDGGIIMYDQSTDSFIITPSTYTHNQSSPSSSWSITHNLGRFPSVTVVDSGGSLVEGNIVYVDNNHITITFTAAFGGLAYLN